MTDRELISTTQAAAIVGCNRETIRRAIQVGSLPSVQIGGRFAVLRADVAAWVEAGHYNANKARYTPRRRKRGRPRKARTARVKRAGK